MDGDKKLQHESFGLIQISRVSSSHAHPLFGSSIGHSQTIELRIYKGEQIRSGDLSYDCYHDREQLICVEMSNTQFAEMITTMNYGSGTPVTLRRVMGEKMGEPPVENKRQQHSQEFEQKMVKFAKTIEDGEAELQELLKKPKLSKDDKHRMKHLFLHMKQNISMNIPYFEKQFEEQMDNTVKEAKGEVEAFITNAVTKTGLEALRNEGKMMLGEGDDEK